MWVAVLWVPVAYAWQNSADKYIYAFRKDKQFSSTVHYSRQGWQFVDEGENFSSQVISFRGAFRFHLPIWRSLGYVFGTSLGIASYFPDAQGSMYHSLRFPSLLAGVVWYVSPVWQSLVTGEAYIEHMAKVPQYRGKTIREVILESFRFKFAIERFFLLRTAVNFNFGYVTSISTIERNWGFKRKYGWFLSTGLTYHML